jgi:putative ABC transport system substrate-binding protein
MRRREFITLLGGAAVTWPFALRAQQPAMPVIGYFGSRSLESEVYMLQSFRKGLEEIGYVIDQNVTIELRFADGHEDRLPTLAADLVSHQVSVLVANDTPSAVAAKAATSTIPIVFGSGRDPVEIGLVASLSRPGGNATGVHVFVTALGPKRLHLLRELVPNAKLIAVVVNPSTATAPFQVREIEAAAQAIGQDIFVLNASNETEINAAFAAMVERKADAVLFGATTLFQVLRKQVVALGRPPRHPGLV